MAAIDAEIRMHLSSEPQAKLEDVARIEDTINTSNMQITGAWDYHSVRIFLRDDDQQVCGGILAETWGTWLHITFLWVEESMRQQGYGAALLQAAEGEAWHHGCRHAHLETFSFQARPFYERFGYRVIAALEDYPPGHTYYYLRKTLAAPAG
jgi:GNAT superfamily N-acetyltransferase